jgi:hypothetical protein
MNSDHPLSTQHETPTPTNIMSRGTQMGLFIVMLGASAGFVFYTKKTDSLIIQMNKLKSHGKPTPIGPMTKAEWEKWRPRHNDDDFW